MSRVKPVGIGSAGIPPADLNFSQKPRGLIPSRLQPSFQSLVALHRIHESSLDEHRSVRGEWLREYLSTRKLIYLDTNWWIRLREARYGTPRDPMDRRILDRLLELVDDQRIAVPASGTSINEVLHQSDLTSRLTTLSMMDSLGVGVALCSREQQAVYEITSWLSTQVTGAPRIAPPAQSVLTCPLHAVMTPTLRVKGPRPEIVRVLPQLVESIAYLLTYVETAAWWEHWKDDPSIRTALSSRMNDRARIGRAKVVDFRRVFTAEVHSYLDGYWKYVCQAAHPPQRSGEQMMTWFGTTLETARTLLAAEPWTKLRGKLDGLNIIAGLHAMMRVDPARAFRPTDWDDLNHAALALPYANAFFTEHSLSHLVRAAPGRLADQYPSCTIVSEGPEVLKYLDSLGRGWLPPSTRSVASASRNAMSTEQSSPRASSP